MLRRGNSKRQFGHARRQLHTDGNVLVAAVPLYTRVSTSSTKRHSLFDAATDRSYLRWTKSIVRAGHFQQDQVRLVIEAATSEAMAKRPSPFFAMHYYKSPDEVPINVKDCKMDDQMKSRAVQVVRQILYQAMDEKTMAGEIKHILQTEYGGSWHCVVGRVFSSSVTSSNRHYIYLYAGYEAVLLFKTP